MNVGDKVIWVDERNNQKPTVTTVAKVNKKSIRVQANNYRYNPGNFTNADYEAKDENPSRYNYYHKLFAFTEEKLNQLTQIHNEILQNRREQREAQERMQKEREDKNQRQLDEIKRLVDIDEILQNGRTLPDGKRLYIIDAPIHPNHEGHKGYEIVIVKCRDGERWQCEENGIKQVKTIECAMTCTHGSSHSFPSCSTTNHEDDAEAVLESLRNAYFNW